MKETIEAVKNRIDKVIGEANVELAEITECGYPFKLGDVVFTAEYDSSGIYIHSGSTPVCAFVRSGDPDELCDKIVYEIREMVEVTRHAIERRLASRNDAEALEKECEAHDKAVKALEDAGLDASILMAGFNEESAEAVIKATKSAVREANKHPPIGLCQYREFKMHIRGFSGGVVVLVGDKPVLVTRFPKICNAKQIEKTCEYIKADIASIDSSRRAYFARVQIDQMREDSIREAGREIENANERLDKSLIALAS